jgi:hypothetical protein
MHMLTMYWINICHIYKIRNTYIIVHNNYIPRKKEIRIHIISCPIIQNMDFKLQNGPLPLNVYL